MHDASSAPITRSACSATLPVAGGVRSTVHNASLTVLALQRKLSGLPVHVAPPSSTVWPVLVADLADPAARDFLTGRALAGATAHLPLLSAPATASTHVLEVYTPGTPLPLLLLADPLGVPTPVGFPLRLRMYDPTKATARVRGRSSAPSSEASSPASGLRARIPTVVTLTEGHSRELSGEELIEGSPDALVGRAIAGGKLQIKSVIGAGGVGYVYRAAHRDLRIPVAVKVLHHRFQNDIEFCRRFHSEALASSQLDHPNLMRVLDFGQEPDGLLYLAMEHLDGTCLARTLEPERALPLARIVGLMSQICAGLAHAHSRGIVHRDVKPENIVLVLNKDDDERPAELVKVCDFGIALQQAEDVVSTAVVGTPHYMSPEQCRGEPLDGRSDVYACGVMLYELAIGHLPFSGPTPMSILNQHMFVEPLAPRFAVADFDPRLDAIIMKALAKEPANRQASMRDLRRELRALLEAPTSSPAPPSDPSPSSERSDVVGPDWLERSGSYRCDSTGEVSSVDINGRVLAGELVARSAEWLSALAETERQDHFESLAGRLEAALPVLFAEHQVKTLFAVYATLDELAVENAGCPGWRAARAQRLQQMFAEPTFLSALADAALSDDAPRREVTELVRRVGGPAAYALYSARLRMSEVSGARLRFVQLVRGLGIDALPMIRAGLARLETKRDVALAAALAADLLQASPRVVDEEAGDVTARYLEGSGPGLTTVAAEALVAFWGRRAIPLLLGLLGSEDEAVTIAAMNGLRQLNAVDERAVARIALAAEATRSSEVRRAARSALMETIGPARAVALLAVERFPAEHP